MPARIEVGYRPLSTYDEYTKVVRSLNPWKASGADCISPAMIKYAPDEMHKLIYKLIYSIELFEVFPEGLTKSYIMSILKKEP